MLVALLLVRLEGDMQWLGGDQQGGSSGCVGRVELESRRTGGGSYCDGVACQRRENVLFSYFGGNVVGGNMYHVV